MKTSPLPAHPFLRLLLLLFYSFLLTSPAQAEYTLQRIWPNFSARQNRPILLLVPPDGSEREFLVQQRGQIDILPSDRSDSATKSFLDFSNRDMEAHKFEEGLIGFAFHPKFKENRRCVIAYSQQDPKRTVISEIKARTDNPDQADLESERILMEIRQPFWNHNSGNMLFGADGYLYISVGDGGKKDGAHNLSQNLFSLSGKVLRIDLEREEGALPYGIPSDNPLVKTDGVRPEIYAYGLRNLWGICFHPGTGELWGADVGQETWEEINRILPGKNYGWNFREGAGDFVRTPFPVPTNLESVDPVHQYDRKSGISITGGYFYGGEKLPDLKGKYIYGDWGFGTLWALTLDAAGQAKASNETIYQRPADVDFQPTAFCEDKDGELVILDWKKGHLYTLAPR